MRAIRQADEQILAPAHIVEAGTAEVPGTCATRHMIPIPPEHPRYAEAVRDALTPEQWRTREGEQRTAGRDVFARWRADNVRQQHIHRRSA